MYSSQCFKSDYMEFVGYDTCDKLIWASGEVSTNKNKLSRQESIKHISTGYILHLHYILVVLHTRTLVISHQRIWFHADLKHIHRKRGGCIELYK